MSTTHEIEITEAQAGWRMDRAIAELLPTLSRARIQVLIGGGQAQIIDKNDAGTVSWTASRKVKPGERFTLLVPDAVPDDAQPQDIALDIVFEDEHLLIVDKPAGLVVHPAAGNFDGTLVNALLHHCAGRLSGIGGIARPGIVHRIDKDTSGLLVVAKTDPAHERLSKQFAAHTVERIYDAIVKGTPKPADGRIEGALARSNFDRKKIAIVADGRGKHAVTHYRTVTKLGSHATHIHCQLETGRTHQVRVHMASIGHSLLGDPVYGRTGPLKSVLDKLEFRRQALHAGVLGFVHPSSGEAVRFESAIPADMRELMEALTSDDQK
jgi:23S rRNA pseudouridine1911/1915/1917 synthase